MEGSNEHFKKQEAGGKYGYLEAKTRPQPGSGEDRNVGSKQRKQLLEPKAQKWVQKTEGPREQCATNIPALTCMSTHLRKVSVCNIHFSRLKQI